MNIQEYDILKILYDESYQNQRILAQRSHHSLGIVNRSIASLLKEGYIDSQMKLTQKGKKEFSNACPKRAIILAAGVGMRMIPINMETPKAFLQVHGECLVERQIKQLHQVGINEIYIIVGFLKEQFEYLIDKYHVQLIFNPQYTNKGNLYSLKLVEQFLENTYIIPSDIWCKNNPFNHHELYSWYMVTNRLTPNSDVKINRKYELAKISKNIAGNAMIGICYLTKASSANIKNNINLLCQDASFDNSFWEEALYYNNRMLVHAKSVESSEVVEINTYEELRELDYQSSQLKSNAISTIAQVFHIRENQISNITTLKKGMTNRSFVFTVNHQKYIMRIPGEGTSNLINRRQEYEVYSLISDKHLCDSPIYINPDNGYKITKFIDNVRTCNPYDLNDLKKCMIKLKEFHSLKLKVTHRFDLFQKIDFYETLWGNQPSVYLDYEQTKKNVFSLQSFIDTSHQEECLTHIDAVPDNFLFGKDKSGNEIIQLTDWEYAGMQDPHVDIAMFCIYAMYDKKHIDQLIDIYFNHSCTLTVRAKIYCYISVCGLLWSNWCEYKRNLGIEFGEYSLKQYRFAKEFYVYSENLIKKVQRNPKTDEQN